MNQQHAQDLLKAEKERTELLTEQYRKETERLRGQLDELSGKWAEAGRALATSQAERRNLAERGSGEVTEATEYGVREYGQPDFPAEDGGIQPA